MDPPDPEAAALYLHFPCFDGVVSGTLAILFLESVSGWKFETIQPVNYDVQPHWAQMQLPSHSAIVDFLYHPGAAFWCDHHATTFLAAELRADYFARRGPYYLYDPNSRSCARVLWNQAAAALESASHLDEMVSWADKIDSADYEDVQEAMFGDAPALSISHSLAVDPDSDYCSQLVRALCRSPLSVVAGLPEVQGRANRARELSKTGLERMHQSIHFDNAVAAFDVDTDGVLINRYSPFYLCPQARYSIGLFRSSESLAIRANANPWLDFPTPNLGELMRSLAGAAGLGNRGGGHSRVGALILPCGESQTGLRVFSELVRILRSS